MKKLDRKQLAGIEYHGKSDVTRSFAFSKFRILGANSHVMGFITVSEFSKYSQIPSDLRVCVRI